MFWYVLNSRKNNQKDYTGKETRAKTEMWDP